jgi:hypothetical protein
MVFAGFLQTILIIIAIHCLSARIASNACDEPDLV